jgi:transcriptional regulator with XRE-family HTH domain
MAEKYPLPSVGALLKRWRTHRGMSQLALSFEAELSARHVSFIETGRSSPSRESLTALAEALDVPLRERNVLFEAAGYARPYVVPSPSDDEVAGHRRLVERVLRRHEPYFAVAIDRHWNVRLRNQAAARSLARYEGTGAMPDESAPNLARLLFHPEGLMSCLTNGPAVAAHFLDRLRQESLRNPMDEELAALFVEMEEFAPPVPHRQERGESTLTLDLLIDGLHLRLLAAVLAFDTAGSIALEELRIETFFPADDSTATLLEQASHSAASAAARRQGGSAS